LQAERNEPPLGCGSTTTVVCAEVIESVFDLFTLILVEVICLEKFGQLTLVSDAAVSFVDADFHDDDTSVESGNESDPKTYTGQTLSGVQLGEMADDHDDCPGKGNDLIFVGPPVDEKRRLYMRHRPDCQVDIGTGEFRGAPEKGEILPEGALRLRHRDDGAYDVK
jgi:hypothetical protein